MEPFFESGLEWIMALQQMHGPVIDSFFRGITFMGEEMFYLLIIPFLFWSVDPALGARVGVAFLLSAYLNPVLKDIFQEPRPFHLDATVQLSEAEGTGMPSGHSQTSVMVWGVLAWQVSKKWFWAIAITFMLLIGFSRVFLGVHFPHQVLAGWSVGIIILAAYVLLEPRVESLLATLRLREQLAIAFSVPSLLALLFLSDSTVATMAVMAGFGCGLAIHLALYPLLSRWFMVAAPASLPHRCSGDACYLPWSLRPVLRNRWRSILPAALHPLWPVGLMDQFRRTLVICAITSSANGRFPATARKPEERTWEGIMKTLQSIIIASLFILLLAGCATAPDPQISYDPSALQFDGDLAFATETEFVTQFPNRHSGQPNNRLAAEWLQSQFGEMGLTCTWQEWEVINFSQPLPLNNVICSLPGESPREIVIVAHHDQFAGTIQGAGNDGSGIAIMLELAKIFAAEGVPCLHPHLCLQRR